MKWKIQNQFLANYLLMFIISTMIGFFAFALSGFATDVLSKTLVKTHYTAKNVMQDDYRNMNTAPVIENGGGVQVINSDYEIIFSAGLNTFAKDKLTAAEFTKFLTTSKSVGVPYSYDIKYNSKENFWLVVTFPTSIRIDFAIAHNKDFVSADRNSVVGAIAAILLFYLLLLALSTVIYSKITSIGIVSPLKKLTLSAQRLRDGNYSARVDLGLKNEFGELQDTFNTMAQQIEEEISLRKQSEENRKKLVLDISHDLKNPLASIAGYAELCKNNPDLSKKERESYLKIICENSNRVNNLINDLFELSKMESSEFVINKTEVDVCEYMREEMGKHIPVLDEAGFIYEFDIPGKEIFAQLDTIQMSRVFQNLITNAVKYNHQGTNIMVSVLGHEDEVFIIFKDDGVGMTGETAAEIFKPFVRADAARNSQTGGTGLGLAIVEKIIAVHGGTVRLKTAANYGCEFIISIPKS